MVAVVPSLTKAEYLLPRDATESQRLNGQHRLVVEAFDNQLIHPSVVLPENYSVLDCGTGTSIYLKSLGEQLQRPHPSELVGCDYSETQFPPLADRTVKLPNNTHIPIQLFQHDVTQPLPREHHGKYDFVHQRLLIGGIKKELWPRVIANLCQALKPGGWLQLFEFDISFAYEKGTPAVRIFEQAQKYMENSFGSLGMNIRIPHENKAMVEACGLEVCESVLVPYPIGNFAISRGLPADYGEASLLNTRDALMGITRGARKVTGKGPEEEELQKFLKDYEELTRVHGCSIGIGITVGRKPLE